MDRKGNYQARQCNGHPISVHVHYMAINYCTFSSPSWCVQLTNQFSFCTVLKVIQPHQHKVEESHDTM